MPLIVLGYDAVSGLDINLPDGARTSDLLAHLEILKTDEYMVTMDNTVKKPTDVVKNGDTLFILQCLAGG